MNDPGEPAVPPRPDLGRLGDAPFPEQIGERDMRELAESLPGAVFQMAGDRQNNIRYNFVSRRVREVLGVEPSAILSNPLVPASLVLPEDSAKLFNGYRESARAMKPFSVDVRVRRPDGIVRWVRTFATPRKAGDVFLWDGYWNDVTDEVEAHIRLEAAERRLREITDSLPGTLFQNRVDPAGKITLGYVSSGIVDLWGIDPATSTNLTMDVFGCVLPEDRDLLRGGIRSQGKGQDEGPIDFRIRHARTGEIRWIRTLAAPRLQPDGSIHRNGYWQDITDIKALQDEAVVARERLAASEQRLRDIVANLPGVVYQFRVLPDDSYETTYMSEALTALAGIEPSDDPSEMNARIWSIVMPSKFLAVDEATLRAARDLTPLSYEFQIRHGRTGELRWIRTQGTPKREADGSTVFNGFWQDVTDVKALQADSAETRELLTATERRLGDIIATVPGAIYQFRVGDDGAVHMTYLSDGIQRLTGITQEEGRSDEVAQYRTLVPEDMPRVASAIAEATRNLALLSVDFRIVHARSGETRWIRSLGQPQREADGAVLFNGFWQDITDTRRMEEELRNTRDAAEAAERRLREIAESLPGVVYRMVFEGRNAVRYTDMTGGAQALYGVSRDEIFGDSTLISGLLHPDDRLRVNAEFMSAAMGRRPVQIDFRIQRRDGVVRWLRTYAAPSLIPTGVAWVGYTTDVTVEHEARESADEALRQLLLARDSAQAAEGRLRAIFDHTKIGLVMIDRELTFSNANPSLRELLIIADEQEFTRDFPSFSPPLQPDGRPSMEKAREVIEFAFAEGYNRFDWMHQTRAGEPRPCEIALTRVELSGVAYIFATMTDLRERKRVEAALERASIEAQTAAKAKGDFLANMSHEIRTPMNAIIGLSHLGLRARDVDHARDYLAKIQNSAQSLLQILNDILDVSKIEAGKLSLESTAFDLYEVLDNLSGMLSVRAAEKGLELLFDVDPRVPGALVGDPLRLGQVLLNLTGNAIKFTDGGQILVKVGLAKAGRDFARLKFEISDTGIGMTSEQVGRLFQAFAQADSSTTRRFGGTGLGLTICKRLVEMMDGDIGVDSVAGKGSTFRFDVRLGLGAAGPAVRRVVPEKLRDLRVLIADDNPTAVEILRGYLEGFGFRVTAAGDGAEAVARVRGAKADPFGLVLMDWQMPRMNGIEASRSIRELGPPHPPHIIMVTAFGREEVERQAQDAKLDGFLVKPVNPSVLFDAILEAFGAGVMGKREDPRRGAADGERLRGLRVLVAEDNEINQQVARELLEEVGVEVTIAENGVLAVERLRIESFDAVLMDLQMPEMDGLEATRRIRERGGAMGRVPIIAMTANAMAEDRDRCLEAGMDDHIGKPVDVNELYEVLARHAPGGGGTSTASRAIEPPASPPPAAAVADPVADVLFDFASAVARLGGSRTLFTKLANRFLASSETLPAIEAALLGGDMATARRTAHTVKGVAASLGALRLSRAAAEVDRALRESGTPPASVLDELAGAEAEARSALRDAVAVV